MKKILVILVIIFVLNTIYNFIIKPYKVRKEIIKYFTTGCIKSGGTESNCECAIKQLIFKFGEETVINNSLILKNEGKDKVDPVYYHFLTIDAAKMCETE